MIYGKSFFALQLQFSRKVASLAHQPLERVLFDYTNFYIRFGLGREFDPANPAWQTYLASLAERDNPEEWTYRFYLNEPEAMTAPAIEADFGCFSYALRDDARIKLHFRNTEAGQHSPLAIDRLERRREELAELFRHVRQMHPERTHAIGASWLYNVEAYRRLFPASYLETARPAGPLFQRMSLWGQFLDRHGETKDSMTRPFLSRLAQQSSLDRLIDCFPFQVLLVEAPVIAFRETDDEQAMTEA
ncbi:MAG: hypothetical protein JRH01_21340 [Deltaproteobacteria bacterium]|nr:hypothetical protein [Deltaproteobacteria bacterium]MBW2395367.1 hypothetical protein [Deltaproteobacteria bacterium]